MCDKGHVLGTVTNGDSTTSYSHFRDMAQGHHILQFSRKARNLDFSSKKFLLLKMLCNSNKILLDSLMFNPCSPEELGKVTSAAHPS